VLVVIALIWPQFQQWTFLLAFALAVLGFDLVLCRNMESPRAQRRVSSSLAVNRPANVSITLANTSQRNVRLLLTDELPADCQLRGSAFPRAVELGSGAAAEIDYVLVPERRGSVAFGQLIVLLRSPLGFWEARRRLLEPHAIRVYPDFAIIAGYLDLLAGQHAIQLGIRLAPRRGEGLEFHQLREYRPGDSVRQIDWKATARRQTLISREYQEERDQRVLFLIDSGRRMRTRDGSLSHFDHALNAMLLLAYVALRQGDSVALKVFGHEDRWVPPQRGVAGVNTLLNETYDLHTGTEAADYLSIAEDVMTRQRKRSLVVLLTNLREEDLDLAPALKLLRQRHVVLIGNLRERILDETAEVIPENFATALKVAGTHGYVDARRRHQQTFASLAHLIVDCVPEELPVSVVNAYWQVKRSGSL
jgi:uncharacterized protein (DUF58 family)